MNQEQQIAALETMVERLQAIQAAHIIVINSLIASNSRYHDLQMDLTAKIESADAAGGVWSVLTDRQRAVARETAEWLQTARCTLPPSP